MNQEFNNEFNNQQRNNNITNGNTSPNENNFNNIFNVNQSNNLNIPENQNLLNNNDTINVNSHQQFNNEFNNQQGNNNITNGNTSPNENNFNNIFNVNQSNNLNIPENQNLLNNNDTINVNSYQQLNNDSSQINSNTTNNSFNSNITKKCKVLMFIVLIISFLIVLDEFLISRNWFLTLQVEAMLTHNEQLKISLDTLEESVEIINWTIVLIITIFSIIFLVKDRKKNYNKHIFDWYILAGAFHIFFGTIGLTHFIYSISTLFFAVKNRKYNLKNNINVKSDNILIVLSLLTLISIIFMETNLFNNIENKVKDYRDNKEVIVEDKDNNHIVTTFDKIINDWGNNVTKNKSYKIKNVKLNNTTASLYIDYTFNLKNDSPVSTITIKHGDNNIYTYTEETNYFNLSYLNLYNNLIIYGTSYCDNIDNGVCKKHLTYSQVYAFNKDDSIPLYDKTIINKGKDITFFNDTSVFLEDESIYAAPYNDFRVYNIKYNDSGIYFYTIVENYDDVFEYDYYFRKNNCNDPFWVSIDFDMQRTFKTKFVYNEKYKYYELGELEKQSSIKYADYCINKNILGF